jgi:hypothetical protein
LLELPDYLKALKSDWKYYVGFSPFVSLSLSLSRSSNAPETNNAGHNNKKWKKN